MFRVVLFVGLAALGTASVVPSKESADEGIVGGVATEIKQHPYQLSLWVINFGYINYHCGASLLKPTVVLTAAHCTVNRTPNKLEVRAGYTYTNIGGTVANVLHIFNHPNYQGKITSYDYDVSVLILDRSFLYSVSIQPIQLQPVGTEVVEGTMATVTGWGHLWSGGLSPSELQMVDLPKFNQQKCASNYATQGMNITERMHCYGYRNGGKSTCQGDSGGPVVVNGKQIGIVSFAIGCADPEFPSVFVKISNWEITAHIQKYMAMY